MQHLHYNLSDYYQARGEDSISIWSRTKPEIACTKLQPPTKYDAMETTVTNAQV